MKRLSEKAQWKCFEGGHGRLEKWVLHLNWLGILDDTCYE